MKIPITEYIKPDGRRVYHDVEITDSAIDTWLRLKHERCYVTMERDCGLKTCITVSGVDDLTIDIIENDCTLESIGKSISELILTLKEVA